MLNHPDDDCVILGCGYVGTFYLDRHKTCEWTSRRPSESRPLKKLTDFSKELIKLPIYFDLNDRESWKNVTAKNVLWAFSPASNFDEEKLALQFYDSMLKVSEILDFILELKKSFFYGHNLTKESSLCQINHQNLFANLSITYTFSQRMLLFCRQLEPSNFLKKTKK